MVTFWGNEYRADTVAKCIRSPIKVQGPLGSLFRSVIWSDSLTVVYCHDVFVREFKLHGLIVIHILMSKVIG